MINATVQLSQKRAAHTGEYHGKTTVAVTEEGRLTPGQWFAATIAQSDATEIYIDFGQGWKLDKNETAILKGFAMGVAAAERAVAS